MPSTASTVFQDGIEGKLISAVTTATTTGITFRIKQINGSTPTCPTAAFRLHVLQRTALTNKHEIWGVASGTTQSGQTVTLGTVTRALPLTDGTDFTGSGTAQSFAAGADLFLSWDSHDASMTMKKDLVNTITGSGAVRGDSTTVALIRPNSVTTTQRDLISAANGDIVYNSTTGRINTYEGGAWGAAGSTTVDDASTVVAGKVEEATIAEIIAETAAGATGARLFINPSLTRQDSTSAAEGHIVALNSTVAVDRTIGGLGSVSGTAYTLLANGTTSTAATQSLASVGTSGQALLSNGAGNLPTFQTISNPGKKIVLTAMEGKGTASNPAGGQTNSTSSSTDFITFDFDTTTAENASWNFVLPGDYTAASTITAKAIWRTEAGGSAETLVLGFSAVSYADLEAAGSYGTQITVTDTWSANGTIMFTPESAAITIAGTPAAGELVSFKVQRVVASDTLAGDALLMAVVITYT